MWNSRNQGDNVGNGVGMQQISVKLRGKLGKSVRKGAEMRNARGGEGLKSQEKFLLKFFH